MFSDSKLIIYIEINKYFMNEIVCHACYWSSIFGHTLNPGMYDKPGIHKKLWKNNSLKIVYMEIQGNIGYLFDIFAYCGFRYRYTEVRLYMM